MNTYLKISRCQIECYDGEHKLITAFIIDNLHKLKYEIIEWLDNSNHIDRENSELIYDKNLYQLSHEDVELLHNLLDNYLNKE